MQDQTNYYRFDCLDNLEIFSAGNYCQDFPPHFHEQLCITLVHSGVESTVIDNESHYTPSGAFSLTSSEVIHSNPNRNLGSYSFLTYYLSPDLAKYLLGRDAFDFRHLSIEHPILFSDLSRWTSLINAPGSSYKELTDLLSRLLLHCRQFKKSENSLPYTGSWWQDATGFIDANLDRKITLGLLSAKLGMDPYRLIRTFRKEKGHTPVQYVLSRKITQSKKLLRSGLSIVDTALSTGFYDQSHYTNFFKRVTGVTPGQFQKACNIFQD